MSKKINLLPEHIIDQIKAGEVIERPSTLIKEIIENAIDAHAKNIQIQIINNGMDLISIEDDGDGISFDDLPLAFARHATSKIDKFEDLYNLYSYGFRGEALASISSISKVTCESTTDKESSLFKIEGGEVLSHLKNEKKASNAGTKLFIKDLFYNTPVRLKFLQSKTSEKNQIRKILNSFLLTHPEIKFSIKWDDNDKKIYPETAQDLSKRIKNVFFKKGQDDRLLNFEQNYDNINVNGFLSFDSSRGNANRQQYLFINERYIQDITLHKIIVHNALGFWPIGEAGSYVLYLKLPADQIDVNVHPNKTVVKVFEASKVQSILSGALKRSFKETSRSENTNISPNSFGEVLTQQNFEESPVNFFQNLSENDHRVEFKPIQYKTAEESLNSHDLIINENILHIINESFGLYQRSENSFYIINLNKLLGHAYKKALYSNNPSTPLLISTPYKDPKKNLDHLFDDFGTLGLELDRLDSSTVAIRSVPHGSGYFSHSKILQEIVNLDIKPKSIEKFLEEIFKINTFKLEMTASSFKEIFNKFELTTLIKEDIAKELNSLSLQKLFS